MRNIDDRFDAAKDDVKGKAKEKYGDMTNDESKQAEGKMDQFKGDVKDGMADVKDKAGDLADKIKGKDDK